MHHLVSWFILLVWKPCDRSVRTMSAMTPAQELQQMYAGILPSLMDIQEGTRAKRPPEGALDAHQQQKPRRSRAKGQGKGKETDHQDGNLGHHQQLQAVARLLLRHDAQLNRLAQDTTVLCTFTNKPLQPEAILPHQDQISAEWKKRMESSQKPSMSLRVTIFQALLLELKSRLQKIVGSEENKAVLRRQGDLSPTNDWLFLRWEPGTESLKPVPDRSMHLKVLEEESMVEGNLLRFQANRPLAEELTGHQLTFTMELGLRNPGATKLYRAMLDIQGVAALQTVALRIHTPRMQQSKLAEQVASLISTQSAIGSQTS